MDEMIIVSADGTPKILVDRNNMVQDIPEHECTFNSFEEDSVCICCGKLLGDVIEAGFVPCLIPTDKVMSKNLILGEE